ncbi:hypothetical protein [Inquilinus sp. CAU 1745]|uniref:hypothetical protein n=1 Tax=Inquilinus sp. CAU 1745 TaxID=3140369 RepID=UPI00325BFC67
MSRRSWNGWASDMIDAASIAFAPLLPWTVLGPLFGLAAAALLVGLFRRAPGMTFRFLTLAALAVVLVNPSLVREEREPIDDVAVVVVDESPSQEIGARSDRAEEALAALETELAAFEDLEVRVVRPQRGEDSAIEETALFDAVDQAVADIPRRRIAGTVLITDGQVHDVPEDLTALDGMGPVHTLLTGEREEADRRLVITNAPSFGLVDRTVTVTVRIDDLPAGDDAANGSAAVTVTQDGTRSDTVLLPVGVETPMEFTLDHGGQTVLEFEVEAAAAELSLANNRAAVAINGVRDRLRVLLVSGEPHSGERTWRNILKSDPSVDLVHFTILRPPEKQDGTPINELSLISFPIRELFELRLNEFDLIIFDRYRRRGVLPNIYLSNIAEYVTSGGAFLEASGPQFASSFSLYRTPLGDVLPGEPTGEVLVEGFRPDVTELGHRHPVTAGLAGVVPPGEEAGEPGAGEPEWGRWFRQIDVRATGGSVLMDGIGDRPLLILDRVGEGRVAQLASDQIWLWSRGYEGGGPQAELLRRLAHWLMKEPELEENDLRTVVDGDNIRIVRRSLEELPEEVRLTTPSGEEVTLTLVEEAPGLAIADYVAREPGIFRVEDGEFTALAVVGTLNPPELSDVRTTAAVLEPAAEATGGGIFWLADGGLPDIRRTDPDRAAAGDDWLGLRANGDYIVTGVRDVPLLPAALALFLILGALLAAWRREGR